MSTTRPSGVPATIVSLALLMLRWYMRIAGCILILVPLTIPIVGHPSFTDIIGEKAPEMLVGLAPIIGSFGVRVNWLLGALLAFIWVIVSFGAYDDAPLPFEMINVVLAVSGLVIVAWSYRAAQGISERRP
jgi:hypothetical protein